MQLLMGDCLERLTELEDKSIDMVLSDAPYSGGVFAADRQKSTSDKYFNPKYNGSCRFPDFDGDNMDQNSFTEFMQRVLKKARQKSKDEAIIAMFIDWRNIVSMINALQMAGWLYKGIVVWDKGNARNIPGRFRQDCEFIIWGTNGKKSVHYVKGVKSFCGCYRVKSVSTKKKHHQTEKPVELLEELIKICPNGGTVLDMFMGSGSTGVACVNMDRDFVGIEEKRFYFETATARIEQATERKRIE